MFGDIKSKEYDIAYHLTDAFELIPDIVINGFDKRTLIKGKYVCAVEDLMEVRSMRALWERKSNALALIVFGKIIKRFWGDVSSNREGNVHIHEKKGRFEHNEVWIKPNKVKIDFNLNHYIKNLDGRELLGYLACALYDETLSLRSGFNRYFHFGFTKEEQEKNYKSFLNIFKKAWKNHWYNTYDWNIEAEIKRKELEKLINQEIKDEDNYDNPDKLVDPSCMFIVFKRNIYNTKPKEENQTLEQTSSKTPTKSKGSSTPVAISISILFVIIGFIIYIGKKMSEKRRNK